MTTLAFVLIAHGRDFRQLSRETSSLIQAQKEYLEPEENRDLEHMRQIAIKFGSALGKVSQEPPPTLCYSSNL